MSKKILISKVIKKKIKGMYTVVNNIKKKHKKYRKFIKKKKKYIVQSNIYNIEINKNIIIKSIIPKSKLKRWQIIKN